MTYFSSMVGKWAQRTPSSGLSAQPDVLADILVRRGYRIQKVIKPERIIRVTTRCGTDAVFKRTSAAEAMVYKKILPHISGHVVTSELLDSGFDFDWGDWILLAWIDGRSFFDLWSEEGLRRGGGRAIPLETVDMVIAANRALAALPVGVFSDCDTLHWTAAQIEFHVRGQLADPTVPLSVAERHLAFDVLDRRMASLVNDQPGFSNGDLQVRNLLQLSDGRPAIVDWEAARWSYLERELSFAYQDFLMWRNPAWQRAFRRRQGELAIDPVRLALAQLIVSAGMLWLWRGIPELAAMSLSVLRRELTSD